ncbi:pancreatic lipase-related protein 2 isoform X2 [Musca domestica]|uniref:Pancreatic lipase-related protein 2 isoform X2 n=1 Tax=Musca domestica TaxID=7370 RepID=A0ABM3UQE1_MUSDO|nr:pancreatic lipase-related protein 2 isoform X2 [Musca domestica]
MSQQNLKFIWVFLAFVLKRVELMNLNSLIQKANIYYQQPLQNGTRLEFPLDMIEDLKVKTDIKVIIHGFTGNRFHTSIRPLGQAYMAQGVDNVFLVDWRDAAKLDYYTSRKAVGDVGKHLGQLLEMFFEKHQIMLSEVHVIGHSLGAHIAGNIGRYFNGLLGRVTGLDPALPLFLPNSPDSLHPSAAVFVDVIHTDYPVFGDITPRGTVDFYPNFGHTPQRGCEGVDIVTANSCSHNRAVLLYAESIGLPNNFPSMPCTLKAIKMHMSSKCMGPTPGVSVDEIGDSVVYMGEYVSKSSSGIFYLSTYGTPPFGIGMYTPQHG